MDLNIHLVPESVTLAPSVNPAADAAPSSSGVPASNVQRGGLSCSPDVSSEHFFSRITPSAHAAGAAPSLEAELRSVAQASAKKLMETIRFYEHLDYLDTKNLNTEQLYNLLNEHFNLPFKPRNLRYYRNK